jgi:hypothetical protein
MRIEELGLDENTAAALADAGYERVDELPQDLQTIEGIGRQRAEVIRAAIADAQGSPVAGVVATPVSIVWDGDIEGGAGIQRAQYRGVLMKIVVSTQRRGPDQVIQEVNALALAREVREKSRFEGESAVDEARAWLLATADDLADADPDLERITPLANVAGADDRVLEERLAVVVAMGAQEVADKTLFRARLDEEMQRMAAAERAVADLRSSFRARTGEYRLLRDEKIGLEAEIERRRLVRERAAKREEVAATA